MLDLAQIILPHPK